MIPPRDQPFVLHQLAFLFHRMLLQTSLSVLSVDQKDELAFLLTKMGYVYMFDIHSGKTVYRAKVTQDTVFVTCSQVSTGAVFGITVRKGQVFRIQLNGQALVPYITSTLRDNDLAFKLAGRLDLPGAENLYAAEFDRLMSTGNVAEAAKIVASRGNCASNPCDDCNAFSRFLLSLVRHSPCFSTFRLFWRLVA